MGAAPIPNGGTSSGASSGSSGGSSIVRDATDLVDMDYIEIGTSNFNTISQMLDPSDPASLRGLAVEPSLEYLTQLPSRPGVTKVNAALVTEAEVAASIANGGGDGRTDVDFYFIPEATIKLHNFAQFWKGCNSIGDYHLMHVRGGMQKHVVTRKVQGMSVRQLLTEHHVRRVRLLKIDAEGYDITILHELYLYLVARGNTTLYPERIVFESNSSEQRAELDKLLDEFASLGYKLIYYGDDTIIEYGI